MVAAEARDKSGHGLVSAAGLHLVIRRAPLVTPAALKLVRRH